MIATVSCETCGELNGMFIPNANQNLTQFAYCRCRPEGWVECGHHEGNVRRRARVSRTRDEQGEYHYDSTSALATPCKPDTCVASDTDILKRV